MKKRTKRLLAMLLASAMILQQGSTMAVLATESEPTSETVAETTAATEAETKTPETKAPETQAPETKAPETAAPETQAVSETQATEAAPDATQTETAAPETTETAAETTEKATEEQTAAPEKSETAVATEAETKEAEEQSDEMLIEANAPMAIAEEPKQVTGNLKDVVKENGLSVTVTDLQDKAIDPTKEYSIEQGYKANLSYALDDYKKNQLVDQLKAQVGNRELTNDDRIVLTYPAPTGGIKGPEPGTTGPIYEKGTNRRIGDYLINSDGSVSFSLYAPFVANQGNIEGTFSYEFQCDKNKLEDKDDFTFKFEGSLDNVTVKVKREDITVTKTYELTADGKIKFTIEVKGGDRDSDDIIFFDTPSSNLSIDWNSFQMDGVDISSKIQNKDETTGSFEIHGVSVPKGGSVTITYTAEIKDTDLDTDNNGYIDGLYNLVKWKQKDVPGDPNWGGQANPSIKKESNGSKSAVADKDTIKWTVKINDGDFKKNVAGKVFTDTLTDGSDNQVYDRDSLVIKKDGEVVTEDYKKYVTWNPDGKSFTFSIPGGSEDKSEYELSYSTTVKRELAEGESLTVNNKGTLDGEPAGEASGTITGKEKDRIIKEKVGTFDNEVTLRQTWKTTVNPPLAGWANGFVVNDVLKNASNGDVGDGDYQGFVFDEGSFKIHVNGKDLSKDRYNITFKKTPSATDKGAVGNDWFEITFTGSYASTDVITIEYDTKPDENSDFKTDDQGVLYNTSWTDGKDAHANAPYHLNLKSDIYKDYDYNATKYDEELKAYVITWKVYANDAGNQYTETGAYDLDGADITIVETLPQGLKYQVGSAKVKRWSDGYGRDHNEFEPITPAYDSENPNILYFEVKNVRKEVVMIEFKTIVTEAGNKTYTNTASWRSGETTYGKAKKDVTVQYTLLSKEAGVVPASESIEENTTLGYTIKVNEGHRNYLPDAEVLVLKDEIPSNVELVNGSVKIYRGPDDKEELEGARYSYDTDTRVLTIWVPDETYAIVHYQVTPVLDGLTPNEQGIYNVHVTNTVELEGNASVSSQKDGYWNMEKITAQASGSPTDLTLVKVDAEDTGITLQGAEFKLVPISIVDGKVVEDEIGIQSATTGTNGVITFKNIVPNKVYYYQETKAPDGFKLSEKKHYFIYKGTEQQNNAFDQACRDFETACPDVTLHKSSGGAIYTVTNHATDKAQIVAKKTLENASLSEYTFHFTLTEVVKEGEGYVDKENAYTDSVTNDTNGDIAFKEIEYTEARDYYYRVAETKESAAGIQYDENSYIVTVHVTRDELTGRLRVTVEYPEGKDIEFVNTYSEEEKGSLTIQKTTTAPSGVTAPTEFKFTVQDESGRYYAEDGTNRGNTVTEITVKVNEPKTIPNLPLGTYTVTEVKTGMTIPPECTWKVTVDGKETASTKVTLSSSTKTGTAAFVNTYTKNVELALKGTKTMDGKAPETSGSFTFTITDETDYNASDAPKAAAVVPTGLIYDGVNGAIDISGIKFKATGIYTLKVVEKAGESKDINYDDAEYNVVVSVGLNTDGTACEVQSVTVNEKAVIKDINGVWLLTEGATFANTSKKGSLTVTKNVTGDNTDTTTTFHFKVTLKDGTAAAAVNGTFDGVKFENGVATFDLTPGSKKIASKTITGLPAGLSYTVEEVSKEGENTGYVLTGTTDTTGTIVADSMKTAVFTNTRNKTKAELKVEKTYNDTFPTEEDEQFSFTLTAGDNDVVTTPPTATPMPEGSDGSSKTVKVPNSEPVTFGEITYVMDGTYNYTIKENSGSLSGVTYDASVYHVQVKVTTYTEGEHKGEKKAEISVAKAANAGATVGSYALQNGTIYTADFNNTHVADGSAELSVQKEYNGSAFPTADKAFKFTLTAGDNTTNPKVDTPMPEDSDGKTKTVPVDSGAAKSFGAIAYAQDGDYFYTIEEVTTGTGLLSDVIYDKKIYQIKVSVKTEEVAGKDTKKATVSYRLSDKEDWQDTKQAAFTATFTNYKIQDAKAELKVKKSYNGTNWPTGDDAFKFTLTAGNNTTDPKVDTPMPSKKELTVTNDIAQTFGEITFVKDGTYNYQISEAKGSFEGVTYDETIYDVKVTVSTNSDGTRTVEVESKKKEEDESKYSKESGTTFTADFKNVYTETQASGKLELNVTKSMKNPASTKDLSKFAFTLKQTSPASTPEVNKNADAKGNAKFELSYGEADKGKTFVYEITEQPGSDATVIYDPTVYTVTVKVADKADAEGVLVVEIQSVTKEVGETTTDLGATGAVTFVNDETTVAIDKIDKDTKASMTDVSLRIVKKDAAEGDPAVDEWKTNGKPHDVTGKLEIGGSYKLEEAAAPSGYTIADPVEFTVNTKGQIVVAGNVVTAITMEDTKNKVSILKIDESGAALTGAKLVVKDAAGNVVKDAEGKDLIWTTGDKAHEITGLAPGTYTLSELEAPAGYDVAADETFTITGKETAGTVIEVEMTDKKTVTTNRSLTVTKNLRVLGYESLSGDVGLHEGKFYVALFSDAARTQRVSDVKTIVFKDATASSVTFNNLAADVTYYVGETDVNGTFISSTTPEGFYPEYGTSAEFKFEGSTSTGTADFTNVYVEWPDSFYLSGQLTVTKKVLLNGKENNTTDTFYARVFKDAALTDPVSNEVLVLSMAGKSTTSVTVTNLTIGDTPDSSRKYYVAETDAYGIPLNQDAVEFEISVDKSEVVLSGQNSRQEVVITNSFTEEEESEFEEESESETEVDEKKTAPKTGDHTDFTKYLLLLTLSAGTCAVLFEEKRRKNRAER